jgi:putative tryptophan/tyrosine transport system substrate-binding protein
MNRREFIARVGGGVAAAWPLAAQAQQSAAPTIGFLSSAHAGRDAGRLQGFRQGLGEGGYVEGRNIAIEYRWAEEDFARLPAMAEDLAHRRVAVIVTSGHVRGALAAQAASKTIPIVFLTGSNPVAVGLVASLNQPGGNLTGVATLGVEMEAKRLELLHEMTPAVKTVGVLLNPQNPNAELQARDIQAAARTLGLAVHTLHASSEDEFDGVFRRIAQLQIGGLVITTDGIFISNSEQLASLTMRHGVTSIFQFRPFAAAGGLMSYGGSLLELYRQTGLYAARILKGEKPGDLPVQQVTKFELIINLKTARGLGLTVPATLLARADAVIE